MATRPQPPCKVLFLIDELADWRGTEIHLHRLLTTIDRGRIAPVVAVVGNSGLAESFRKESIPFHALEIHRVFALSGLRGVFRIARLCRRENVRLIVCYHTASDLLAPVAGLLARVPVISCRRDDGFTKKPIHKKIQRHLNRLISGMISVSAAARDSVERDEGFPAARNQVIWNGEDLQRFAAGPSPIRESLGIPAESCVVTCVGGLDPVKDHATLIDAFARVLTSRPNCYLLVAGAGGLRGELEARAAPLGDRVRFLGHRADVPEILRATDIYAQVSKTEGFSNAILQAMASGLPIVATAVGGNVELITADAGRLVAPGDAAGIAGELRKLAADPAMRGAMGAAARRRAEMHGSIQRMTEDYCAAFERAIQGRRAPKLSKE